MDEPQPLRDWSTLPTDIIILILDRLTSTTEVRRLRSVCTSWRTSLVPPSKPHFHSPLQIPLPCGLPAYLTRSIFYLISDNNNNNNNNNNNDNVWITRVAETHGNYWSLQNPMSLEPNFLPMPDIKGTTVSFLDNNITQLATSYSLVIDKYDVVIKVVLFPIPEQQGFSLLALFSDGRLKLWNSGEMEWRDVPKEGCRYGDVIVYENEFYVTDQIGRVMVINPLTFEWRDVIASGLDTCYGTCPYLVESNGKLYLVHKRFALKNLGREVCRNRYQPKDMAVWFLSQGETGLFWEPTCSLDDHVFFVSPYVTFSVSVKEHGWESGECILFSDDWFRGHMCEGDGAVEDCQDPEHTYRSVLQMFGHDCGVFDLSKETITFTSNEHCEQFGVLKRATTLTGDDHVPSSLKIFWPVPKWLISN